MPIFGYNGYGAAVIDPQTDEAIRAGVGGPVSGASVHAAIGAGGAPSIHAGGLGYGVGLPQYSQFSQPPNAMMFPSGDVSTMATPAMSFVGGAVVGSLVTYIGMKLMKKMKKK
jgi:hypothetical protein